MLQYLFRLDLDLWSQRHWLQHQCFVCTWYLEFYDIWVWGNRSAELEKKPIYRQVYFHLFLHNRDSAFSLHIKLRNVNTFMNSEKEGEKSQRRENLITWLYELIFLYSERSYIYIYILYFRVLPWILKKILNFALENAKCVKNVVMRSTGPTPSINSIAVGKLLLMELLRILSELVS